MNAALCPQRSKSSAPFCARPVVPGGFYCQEHHEAHAVKARISSDERELKQKLRELSTTLGVDVRPEPVNGRPPRHFTPGKAVIDVATLEALVKIARESVVV